MTQNKIYMQLKEIVERHAQEVLKFETARTADLVTSLLYGQAGQTLLRGCACPIQCRRGSN